MGPLTSATPSSVKPPLENRIWYFYAGQANQSYIGNLTQPSAVVRVVRDQTGSLTTQASQITYNVLGKVLAETDPLGRVTSYTYDSNNIDLLAIKQGSDTVTSFANYTAHLPTKAYDAGGFLTTMSYDSNATLKEVDRYASTDNSTLAYIIKYNRDGNEYLTSVQRTDPLQFQQLRYFADHDLC